MKRWLKIGLIGIGVVFIVIFGAVAWFLSQALPLATGFTAKYLCSSTFISQRTPEIVFQEDVAPINPLSLAVDYQVNREQKSVSADSFGFFRTRAIYREGCGCSLIIGTTEKKMRQQTFYKMSTDANRPDRRDDLPWPEGSRGPVDPASYGINPVKLNFALEAAFAEPGPDKPKKTRAIIVVYDGRLVAERYAQGFHKNMPILGWSMSKSVTNALAGIQVKNGLLNISAPAPVAEWQNEDNPRREITLDQLLRMSGGLEFEESYLPPDDTTRMLFESYDFAAYAAGKPMVAKPDAEWNYSSGTANIIARIVRQ